MLDGANTRSGRKTLPASSSQLQRGSRDEFILDSSKALGSLQRVMIGIKEGTGSDWHLDKLEVTCVKSRVMTTFTCKRYEHNR